MDFPAPFVGTVQKVEDQWIDYNGHFNMAYYNVIFDRCGDEAFALVGLGPDYVKAAQLLPSSRSRPMSPICANCMRGDRVRVTAQFLDYDAKRVHYVQEMFHADEGWLACVTENIVMHVDMTAKKSAPFPPDVLAKIEAMHEAHKSLPVPPQVGHKIGIPRAK